MNTVASGSFKNTIYTTSGINIGTVTVNWTSTPNVNTNSSAVTVTVTVANSAKSYRLRNRAYSISCLGSAYHGYTASASDTLANRPFTIYHNADGTKNGVISFYVAGFTFEEEDEEHNITTYTVNAFSVYGNAVLDTIARGSTPTLSASTVAMGNAITINTNRASGSFTHKLTYSFGNTTGTIAENVGASYPWTVPLDLAKQIPTTTSGTVTVYCETFNGSTSLGTKAVTFTATVPDTVKPTISKVVCTDPIGLATTYGGYVQGKSKVNVATTASGAYGSEISTCRVTIGSTTLAGTNVTSDVLYNSGNNSISVTVTDSRGRTASYSTSITVLAYTSPTISKFAAYRCNSDGTENPEGTYVKIAYAGAISPLNNKNGKIFSVKYKQEADADYSPWETKTGSYSYDTTSIKSGFSTDILYNLLFTVTDNFTSATYEINIPTAEVLMDFLANGKGIAFGKVATEEGFDCNFEGHFRQDVVAGYGTDDETSLLELKELIGTGGVVIDEALSDTSTNPVQNKVVTTALNDKAPKSNSHNYVRVFNSGAVNGSGTVTVNDLAKQHFAVGMIQGEEDNPYGNTGGWVHALSMGWTNDTTNWNSQLAMGVQNSDGLYYRTARSSIVGQPWKRVLDSSNYKNYCTPANIGARPIRRCRVGQSGSTTTNPWYKFASITTSTSYDDKSITFKVSTGFDGSGTIAGILTAHFRVDGNKNWQRGELMWEYAGSGINLSDYVLAYKNTGTSCAVELWTKISTGYAHRFFEVLSEQNRISFVNDWTLHNASQAGYADAITEGYTQIASTVLGLNNSITGQVQSTLESSTYLQGNQGRAIINSNPDNPFYVILARMKSTNGVFVQGVIGSQYIYGYTDNATVEAGTNALTKSIVLMNEYGNSAFNTITTSSDEWNPLIIKRTNSTGSVVMSFANNNGTLGYVGMNTKDGALIRVNSAGATSTFLDTTNYKTYVTPSNIGAATIADLNALGDSIGTVEEGLSDLERAVSDWETVVLNLYDDVDSGTVTCYKNTTTKTAVIYLTSVAFAGDSARIASNIPKPAEYAEMPICEDYTKMAMVYMSTNGILALLDWTSLDHEFSAVITYNYVD